MHKAGAPLAVVLGAVVVTTLGVLWRSRRRGRAAPGVTDAASGAMEGRPCSSTLTRADIDEFRHLEREHSNEMADAQRLTDAAPGMLSPSPPDANKIQDLVALPLKSARP